MNSLDALKQFTTIVVDTGDVTLIEKFFPDDATTNPSLILNSWNLPNYKKHVLDAINFAKIKGGSNELQLENAIRSISVNIGTEILKKIPGYISTEINARFSFDTNKCIEEAKKIIFLYEKKNINKSRVLIKLAATWECIKAAEKLEKLDIKCNLTLLFSFAQAKACAESGVFLISPFVGRISDWYSIKSPSKKYNVNKDKGVQSVVKIFEFYKKYGYKTIIMGASFRNIEQILALSGCDKLTISPILLNELMNSNKIVNRVLKCKNSIKIKKTKKLSKSDFLWEHNLDQMAVEKLSEGIREFSKDHKKLELLITSNFY